MRALLAAAASGLALFAAGAASAQSEQYVPNQYASDQYASDRYPNISVAIGPELASKADKIGMREIDLLREDLARYVGRALERAGGQRADLVLEMATPNRPTFEQLGRRPGLSMWSIGVGGASVSGTVTQANGTVEPVSYRWYESDIRMARGSTTWSDANRAFNMLSHRIARGNIPNQGPHRVGHREDGLFGTYRY